jgi:hypothetical protein
MRTEPVQPLPIHSPATRLSDLIDDGVPARSPYNRLSADNILDCIVGRNMEGLADLLPR